MVSIEGERERERKREKQEVVWMQSKRDVNLQFIARPSLTSLEGAGARCAQCAGDTKTPERISAKLRTAMQ